MKLSVEQSQMLEIKRATEFLIGQIKKGWTAQEAFLQVENSYGILVTDCVTYYLNKNFNK